MMVQSRTNRFLLIVLVLLALGVLTMVVSQQDGKATQRAGVESQEALVKNYLAARSDELVLQPGNPVSVVVFSDTDCQFCEKQDARVYNLAREYDEEVSVRMRPSFLPIYDSFNEGLAVACVEKLGADFIAVADLQRTLHQKVYMDDDAEALADAAAEYVDRAAYVDCVSDPDMRDQLVRKHLDAAAFGVGRLPHTFIYTENSPIFELVGSKSTSTIEALIQEALSYQG